MREEGAVEGPPRADVQRGQEPVRRGRALGRAPRQGGARGDRLDAHARIHEQLAVGGRHGGGHAALGGGQRRTPPIELIALDAIERPDIARDVGAVRGARRGLDPLDLRAPQQRSARHTLEHAAHVGAAADVEVPDVGGVQARAERVAAPDPGAQPGAQPARRDLLRDLGLGPIDRVIRRARHQRDRRGQIGHELRVEVEAAIPRVGLAGDERAGAKLKGGAHQIGRDHVVDERVDAHSARAPCAKGAQARIIGADHVVGALHDRAIAQRGRGELAGMQQQRPARRLVGEAPHQARHDFGGRRPVLAAKPQRIIGRLIAYAPAQRRAKPDLDPRPRALGREKRGRTGDRGGRAGSGRAR